jgi:pilus assembly protein TadC
MKPDSGRPRAVVIRRVLVGIVVTVIGGLAGVVLIGGSWGVASGVVTGAGSAAWLCRQPTAAQRRHAHRVAADLPFAIDLVAAALQAGAPAGSATLLAGEAVDGPVGDRLAVVGRALLLGAPPAEAWAQLAFGPRVAGDDPGHRVARAARRSGHSGAALAAALTRVADDLRADAAVAIERRARTAGVLIVLPLGLCFLPAFVLTGLVPVVVAIVGDMLIKIS